MNLRSSAAVEIWSTQLRERPVMLGLDEYVRVADNTLDKAERASAEQL
jgi:hypothetical protein